MQKKNVFEMCSKAHSCTQWYRHNFNPTGISVNWPECSRVEKSHLKFFQQALLFESGLESVGIGRGEEVFFLSAKLIFISIFKT